MPSPIVIGSVTEPPGGSNSGVAVVMVSDTSSPLATSDTSTAPTRVTDKLRPAASTAVPAAAADMGP